MIPRRHPGDIYKILHAHARAIFSTALKAAVISIYIVGKFCVNLFDLKLTMLVDIIIS